MERYFFEAFEGMLRLGPGSKSATLSAIKDIARDKAVKILDIGCGVGTHTFLVADALPNAHIIAIDNNSDYIEELNRRAKELDLSDRVQGVMMSMFEMTFEDATFDYIYSEGSIYIAGFKDGLRDWKRFLKPNGSIICSEISWIVDSPSPEPKAYWEGAYPQIDTIHNKVIEAEELGYSSLDTTTLPPDCWTDNYYVPLEAKLREMKLKYSDNEEALSVIEMINQEIDMYNRYGSEYSYVFYILQRD